MFKEAWLSKAMTEYGFASFRVEPAASRPQAPRLRAQH